MTVTVTAADTSDNPIHSSSLTKRETEVNNTNHQAENSQPDIASPSPSQPTLAKCEGTGKGNMIVS